MRVVDRVGRVVTRFDVVHDADGVKQPARRLHRHDVPRVAFERGAGPVVEALLAAGLEVVVLSSRQPAAGSRQVKALRLRYGTAGNEDRFDAFGWVTCSAPARWG